MTKENPVDELQLLAAYAEGLAAGLSSERMKRIAHWLEKASRSICGPGYFGCHAGRDCPSDHK
jgi:hypothetical protein